jgi:hypothetical protein
VAAMEEAADGLAAERLSHKGNIGGLSDVEGV